MGGSVVAALSEGKALHTAPELKRIGVEQRIVGAPRASLFLWCALMTELA